MLKPKPPVPTKIGCPSSLQPSETYFLILCNVENDSFQKETSKIEQPQMESFVVSNQSVQCHFELNFLLSAFASPYQSIITVFPAPDIRCVLVCGRNQRWVSIGRGKTIVVDGGQKS
jgi:hypothetical protein